MAKTAELFDLQKAGRAHYEAKKYSEALDAFSRAIALAKRWSPSEVFETLERRVAVHVKLGNIDLARGDAMSMVRNKKSDGRGYLRCGQLDRLEDNLHAALRWYDHGLKQLQASDPLRPTLQLQREKTKALVDKKIMTSNSRDPITTLPAELLQFVLNHLDYIDAVKALRVSKSWLNTLSKLKPLTNTIDFSDTRRTINYKMMVASLKRLGTNPKVLVMKGLDDRALNLLKMNLERWRNYTQLEELAIFSTSTAFCLGLLPFDKYNLKSLTIQDGVIKVEELLEILRACTSLKVARVAGVRGILDGHEGGNGIDPLVCPAMRTLDLGGINRVRCPLVDAAFFACFPSIWELNCRHLQIQCSNDSFDLSALASLRRLSFSCCIMFCWPTLPPSIEVWQNYDTIAAPLAPLEEPPKLGDLLQLRCLRFNKTSSPPPSTSFLPDVPTQSLTLLDIRTTSAKSVGGGNFLHDLMVGMHLRNLRELAWGDVHDDEATMTAALHSLTKLESLVLTASRLPGAEIILLLKRPDNRLRQLSLVDCENISAETIEWARSQGVTVHVKKSQDISNSERRVRLQ